LIKPPTVEVTDLVDPPKEPEEKPVEKQGDEDDPVPDSD